MTWLPPGPSDEEYESPGDAEDTTPSPWRRGAQLTPPGDARRVTLEAWDEELTPAEIKGAPPPDEIALRARRRAMIRRAANIVLIALAVLGAAAGVAVGWMHIVGDPLADARPYYEAASRLNAGLPLYPPGLDPNQNRIYLYPPLFAVLLRPFALLPYEWFALLWEMAVVASFIVLLRYLGVRRQSTWIAVGLLGVPIGWSLTIAQAHVPMTLLIALGQPWTVAIAANVKLFPALILLYWLGRREWQSAAAFVIWGALLAVGQLILEPGGTIDYVKQLGVEQLGEPGVLRNFSPFTVSPVVWVVLLFVGAATTVVAARYRWGWAIAVAFATLAPPRLLVYMLSGLLAGLRKPIDPGLQEGDNDPAAIYQRAAR